ncbi:LacI family transcriptional regulator [Pseudarthrobacter sulfonivorans]|uniref:LacI family transcriptional regulator n=1 Tax=Pseudarthrobacter sulfonivorans TaxID=121292 RepID=A0A0U3QX60_9MICC|nr:LacI family DNA-binding transcriptional regulator [Pseudarthrobacter sulfonivorans]ALV41436.1 LacI family transcriptional regulator [Pseudarthrobacter sulfonivorans]
MTQQDALTPRATISDVALLAGVATSTVSRALSNPGRVQGATRKRVELAAAELNYLPNPLAKSLRMGRTGVVALLIPDVTNPFYFDMVRGNQAQLRASGCFQLLCDTDESPEVEMQVLQRLGKTADGAILGATRLSDEQVLEVAGSMPLVIINRTVGQVPSVVIDTSSTMSQAVEHLYSLGHRHIAYISGPATSSSAASRWDAIETAGRRLDVDVTKIGPFTPTEMSGAAAADATLNSGATACIAFNDLVAIGMLRRFSARGICVPTDISVVGCDDIFGADFCNPPLTTMTSPTQQAARIATMMLTDQLQPEGARYARTRATLPTHLTIRGSTGPAQISSE